MSVFLWQLHGELLGLQERVAKEMEREGKVAKAVEDGVKAG